MSILAINFFGLYAKEKVFSQAFFKKLVRVWDSERPVDVRLEPTGVKRRPKFPKFFTLASVFLNGCFSGTTTDYHWLKFRICSVYQRKSFWSSFFQKACRSLRTSPQGFK